ncbi:DUF3515 domain-containing protein [Mycobacterium deserti]|uniref:DUF3515 domain-containing protein n=1 Tax=Mycobacterium deserti TaxID=2978347 RepID=A0ABT2MDJ4_9MYCO|nr:DUF3515 domain-containing protein [Mycobacterium deserti]MCT7659220.1 DUF3515 domain-containing protein [Mycobacterium deserti]
MEPETRDGPPRTVLIAALVVAAGTLIAILVIAALRVQPSAQQAVAIVSIPAPQAESAQCRALAGALPEQLGDYRRAPVAEPAPAGAAAWRSDGGGEPIILRCGLDRPAEFVVGTPLQGVDAVQWFEVRDVDRSTWFAVDRPVYVALTLPQGTGPTPIQAVSAVVAKTLPVKAVDPAPVG